MSQQSEKIYSSINAYLRRMQQVGKTPSKVYLTKKQLEILEGDHKKAQSKALVKTPFVSIYKGLPIEVYHE